MYDVHCHILPALDDGARTVEESLRMAAIAVAGGTSQIICTPHCSSSDPALGQRLERILERTAFLNDRLADAELPVHLHPGMELLVTGPLEDMLRRGEFLTLAGSRYILLEFPFHTLPHAIEAAAAEVAAAGLCPVIAHPERYDCVQDAPEQVERWLAQGWVVQVNRGSITGTLGQNARTAGQWLLRHRLAHLVASDAHRAEFRTPELRTGWDWIARHCSEGYASFVLEANPNRILKDRFIPNPAI